MTNERTDWDRLFTLWETLGRPEPPEIPKKALISEAITLDNYKEWRVDLEAEKIRERELRADAAAADEPTPSSAPKGWSRCRQSGHLKSRRSNNASRRLKNGRSDITSVEANRNGRTRVVASPGAPHAVFALRAAAGPRS